MIEIFKTINNSITQIHEMQPHCWLNLVAPTAEEIRQVCDFSGVNESFIRSALDEEESARIETEGDCKMILIDIPKGINNEGFETVFTLPLALITTKDCLITVCTVHTRVLSDVLSNKIKGTDTAKPLRLAFAIMFNNSTRFLYYLRQIDKTSDKMQKSLSKSMQNKELLELLELQKSLVFFSASLTANYSVSQKLCANQAFGSEERDLLEDVVIENKQAIEMCTIYREIIKNTMDAFASVVSNNQNIVMKFLTAITLILSIPMLIASLWGMNTAVPLEGKLYGFWLVSAISVVGALVVTYFMNKRKML